MPQFLAFACRLLGALSLVIGAWGAWTAWTSKSSADVQTLLAFLAVGIGGFVFFAVQNSVLSLLVEIRDSLPAIKDQKTKTARERRCPKCNTVNRTASIHCVKCGEFLGM
jgi:hypothetical protein